MKLRVGYAAEVLETSIQEKQARWDFVAAISRFAGWSNPLLLSLLIGVFVGCASAARLEHMVVKDSQEQKFPDNTPFRNAIHLAGVSGGEDTNPLWKSNVDNPQFEGALKKSMQAHGLLAVDESHSRYLLNAKLLNLDQPFIGFDMKVTSSIHYTLTMKGKEGSVLDDSITASYTATVSDAFLGMERLRLANEGSIRENIKQFLMKLASYR